MEKIKQGFEKLQKATTVDEVDNTLNEIDIDEKYRISKKAYPKISFTISKEEIQELKGKNVLGEDNLIKDDADLANLNALGKLLYAIAWKNKDLPKIKHIIEGIISEAEKEQDKGIVFYQFGKHLSDRHNEPIIDRHVLRAFGIYTSIGDSQKVEYYRKLSLVGKNENSLINAYKDWLRKDLTEELRNCENYIYHVDKVLFALGKYAKSKSLS